MRLRPRASSSPICGFCRDGVPPLRDCPHCGGLSHPDCGGEGCATLGCVGARPRGRPPLATAPLPLPAAPTGPVFMPANVRNPPPFNPDWLGPPVQGRPFADRQGRGMDDHGEAF